MKKNIMIISMMGLIWIWMFSIAYAIPTLQIGAPAGPGDTGIYADYQANLTNPPEQDTAVTSGSTILAAGVYGNNTLLLGGQYTSSSGNGLNWSDFGFNNVFNSAGAVLMATAPQSAGTLTVNGQSPIYSTGGFENGFVMPNPPANHDPVKDTSPDKMYMFFDIGNFAKIAGAVPNFADETGAGDGEIKSLNLNVTGLNWIHFDVFALETDLRGQTKLVTNLDGNPGSHDVTRKGETPPIPEPSTIMLLGSGILGLAIYGRKRFKK